MTIARKSALGPVAVAIVAAIEASSALEALLAGDKVYSAIAPPTSPLPYVTLGFAQETGDHVFNAPGTAGIQQLDIWTRRSTSLGNMEVYAIYDALYGLLHEQPLSVTGFRFVIGTLELLAITPDPDGETMHAIARYQVTNRQV